MKKLLSVLCLFALLTACGGEAPASTPPPKTLSAEEAAQAVLSADIFSEQLEIVDADIAAALYAIEEYGILDCAAYLSTGATAEECTFLIAGDEETALEILQKLQQRVADQLAAVEDYQPAEVPKLEKAVSGCFDLAEGVMAYLVVANDADGAQDAVAALIG